MAAIVVRLPRKGSADGHHLGVQPLHKTVHRAVVLVHPVVGGFGWFLPLLHPMGQFRHVAVGQRQVVQLIEGIFVYPVAQWFGKQRHGQFRSTECAKRVFQFADGVLVQQRVWRP